ncbi:MAG TPA: catalase [Streptosporangiaceae bacterium]|nr:catalase [Streptosporangiaceae bacterium]
MTDHRPYTTTDAGTLAPSDEYSQSVGPDGPLLLQDHYLIQKMAQFNRERVPERVVHAKGGGAYGVLEMTQDVSQFTKASLFAKGARTDLLIRFSTVAGELGSADTARDPRGFAIKFYTDQGNYDLVGNNTPIFFIRDPQKFQDFIRSQKRRADTHTRDNNMQWDFWTLSPESAHQVTFLMSDRGTPYTWRHMNGYGSHTFLWYNAAGEKFWVKYHIKTDQGIKNFSFGEATAMVATDPDFHLRDLHSSIGRGEYPSWTVQIQVMPFTDAADYRFNPFDLTKVWPHSDYPPITIGKITLNRNPENYFAEIEQAAFEPANFVPGIGASPDKMLQGRLFSYPDTHRHRIGTNYLQLPVNRPKSPVHSYNKDGAMRYANPGDPVYAPNSFGGPAADSRLWEGDSYQVAGEIMRSANTPHAEDDDFIQPRLLWESVLSETDQEHLVANICAHAGAPEVTNEMKARIVEYWRHVHHELGAQVGKGLNGG